MRTLSNPVVWLCRIRNRKGYGVHSPFAYQFLTSVVYEKSPFYAFEQLDAALGWTQRFRIRRMMHLLFRLANFVQPERILAPREGPSVRYMREACPEAEVCAQASGRRKTLCLLPEPSPQALECLDEKSVLVLDNLRRHRKWFAALPATVTFDLHDVGIAFFDSTKNKQQYKVNFE